MLLYDLAVKILVVLTFDGVLTEVGPGVTMRHIHSLSVRLLSEALVRLGVLRHAAMSDIAAGAYRQFYPHSIGASACFDGERDVW